MKNNIYNTPNDFYDDQQLGQFNYGELLLKFMMTYLIKENRLDAHIFDPVDKLWKLKEKICLHDLNNNINKRISITGTDLDKLPLISNHMHRIDLLLKYESEFFPIEVKLGTSNKTKIFPSTFNKFLKDIPQIDKTNQASGNMICFLEKRSILINGRNRQIKLSVELDGSVKDLSRKWGLVLRSESFSPSSNNGNFENIQFLFIFEQLKSSCGNEFSKICDEVYKTYKIHLDREFKK